MNTQEVGPVVCPQCRLRYNAPIVSLIDVSHDPDLKEAFLRGQVNAGQCPQCNTVHLYAIPLLYHDSAHELALALVPSELNLPHVEEQRIIGNLTNRLMNALPPAERRSYMFNPKTFISMESLVKAVLAADGITEDVLQAQAQKLELLDSFFKAQSEEELKQLIKAHEADLDYQFFEILTAIAVEALQGEDQDKGQDLLSFRQMLASMVPQAKSIITQIDEKVGLKTLSPETLLADLQNAPDDNTFYAIVGQGRSLLNYEFFQKLTAQIEKAEKSGQKNEAENLQKLRAKILDAITQIDENARKMIEKTQALLQTIVDAPNPKEVIAKNIQAIDDFFMSVLFAHIKEAEKTRQQESYEKLTGLYKLIVATMQEQMPPEMRLLNQLMLNPAPEAIRAELKKNQAMLTPDFINLLTEIETDFNADNQPQMAQVIAQIKKETQAILN